MQFELTHLKPFGVLVQPAEVGQSIATVDIEALKELFISYQLIVLRGFNTFSSSDELVSFAELWGKIELWPFGKVLELQAQDNPEDHIFDNSYVPLHWDGMYRPFVPEYQMFHCVKAPLKNSGGRTTFSHTVLALEYADPDYREKLFSITATYERQMEFYNSVTKSGIITKHPYKSHHVIRYNEPPKLDDTSFVNPPIQHFDGIDKACIESFHSSLRATLYNPNCFYAHEWQDNDIVIADNFTLLHGREGFVENSPRHLQRVQVESKVPLKNPGLEQYK